MNKLKVAILINSYTQPVWSAELIERLQKSSACEVIAYVLPENPPEKIGNSKRLLTNLPFMLYKLYSLVDRRIFNIKKKDPFRAVVIDRKEIHEVRLLVQRTRFRDMIKEEHLGILQDLKPDILVRLGFRILTGPILNMAKFGVWSYHHADNKVNRGGPAGLWEVINREATTGITLQILSESLDGGRVLYRGLSKTYPWSWYRNKINYYWKSVFILPREVERLAKFGEEAFFVSKQSINPELNFYTYPLYRKPNNGQMLLFFASHFRHFILKLWSNLFFEEYWQIGILNMLKSRELRNAKYLVPPRNTLWADPFYINVEEQQAEYIFFEKQNQGKRGVIEYFKRSIGEKQYEGPFPALKQPFHLSFPNVFKHQGDFFMLPEAGESHELTLYRADVFPHKWKPFRTLLKGTFVDPVLFRQNGLLWLFVNKTEHALGKAADELHIYYNEEGDFKSWTSHPLNPVVSDIRRSRNAGNVLQTTNGLTYRVSQKIEKYYGEAVNLNMIITLSKTDYREVWQEELLPAMTSNMNGLHTLQISGEEMIFDIATSRSRLKLKGNKLNSLIKTK